jgi:membrane protein YdbS with pleckstrin-like domain
VFWTIEGLFFGVPVTALAFWIGGMLRDVDEIHALGVVLPWAALTLALVRVVIVPALRLRRWRWRLDDEELDLRHGAVTEVRTIIPISRIQHVDIRRDLVDQLCGVCKLVVHTAAGATEIPVLETVVAAHARDQLAGLIRRPDDL